MNNPKENIVEVVKDLSENDRTRLFQCVLCENDPETCGCNEKDEDKNGMCLKHRPVVIV